MSVRTTADDKLDEAKTSIDSALKSPNEIVVDQYWGHDGFDGEYFEKIKRSHAALLKLRDDLQA